jgi:ribosome-associated protein
VPKKAKFQWEADSGQPRDQLPASRERSKKRREAKSVEKLIDQLSSASPEQLAALPLTDQAVEGLLDLRRLEAMSARSGLRRKRLEVAGLLRRGDVDALRETLSERGSDSPREQAFQRVERWRDRLLKEGDIALDVFLQEHPEGDRNHLRQLVRQASKDRVKSEDRAAKSYRALFQALRSLIVPED